MARLQTSKLNMSDRAGFSEPVNLSMKDLAVL